METSRQKTFTVVMWSGGEPVQAWLGVTGVGMDGPYIDFRDQNNLLVRISKSSHVVINEEAPNADA